MNVKDFLYEELFSTPDSAMDLLARRLSTTVEFDAFGGKEVFTAVVLTKPIVFAYADLELAAPGGIQVLGGISKFAFKARIIDDPSPHYYLPDPCDPVLKKDPEAQLKRTILHTTFISKDDYTDSGTFLPRVGDFVSVRLRKNVFSYELSFGEFLAVADRASEESLLSDQHCTSIQQDFLSDYQPRELVKLYRSSGAKYVPSADGSPSPTRGLGAVSALSPTEKAAICTKVMAEGFAKEPTAKPHGIPQLNRFSKSYALWRYSQPTAANMKWLYDNHKVTTFIRLSGPGDVTTCGPGKTAGKIECGSDLYWDYDLGLPMTLDLQMAVAKCFGGSAFHISGHSGFKCYKGYTISRDKVVEAFKKGFVLVHCAHGADRTGMAVGSWLMSELHQKTGEGLPPCPAGARHPWKSGGSSLKRDSSGKSVISSPEIIKYMCSYNNWWRTSTKGNASNPGLDKYGNWNLGYAKYMDTFVPINHLCQNIHPDWTLCKDSASNGWEKNMGPGTEYKCKSLKKV